MKRTILATCLAGMCAVALSAQTPAQQPPSPNPTGTTGATTSQDPSTASQRMKGGPLTISGCLKAGDTAGTYTLTKVKAGGAAGTTGDTAAGGAAAGASSSSDKGDVNLTASASDVDLSKHVGHQIEVTGTPKAGATAGGAATTTGDTAAGAAGTSGRSAKSLNVTSVKMISESCSQ